MDNRRRCPMKMIEAVLTRHMRIRYRVSTGEFYVNIYDASVRQCRVRAEPFARLGYT